jgi:UDP-N-acetylglucosamine 2-epimerase
MVVVQGDTTSTFKGALASFYMKIKVVHVEAVLRSFGKYSPFPEESNRILTSHLADFLLHLQKKLLKISKERVFLKMFGELVIPG